MMDRPYKLPEHGRMACRACFAEKSTEATPHPEWRMTNDPGAWGNSTPEILVLGFSKGSTQSDIFTRGAFDDVAFAGMRPRLTRSLQHFGLLSEDEKVDSVIADRNGRFAFGSLIRCSVARLNPARGQYGSIAYSCTGALIPKSFSEIPHIVSRCAEKHLRHLPASLKLVILLGNSDPYIKGCQELLQKLYPESFVPINPVAVRADGRLWIHISHPSGLNGHFESWLTGPAQGSGRKRWWADTALKAFH